MSVKVERDTGWVGMGSRFTLVVNGEKREKIKYNETINLMIDEPEVTLRATQFGVKTNEVIVKDNEHVKITSTRWSALSFVGFILLLLLTNLIDNVLISDVLFILSIALLISIFIPEKHYRIDHIE